MACSIIYDKETGKPTQVYAPNGKSSTLFKNALELKHDPDVALDVWATAYTSQFKLKYGDWESDPTLISLDENGEPIINYVMHTFEGYNEVLKTQFANNKKFGPGNTGYKTTTLAKQIKAKLEKKNPDMKFDLESNYYEQGHMRVVHVPSKKTIDNKFSKNEIAAQKIPVNTLMDRLISNFPGLTYEWVKPNSLVQSEHYEDVKKINAFVRNNKIYLVEGRVLPQDGIEEISHVFVEMLRQSKPSLFKGLLNAASEDPRYFAIHDQIRNTYGTNKDTIIDSEFLAKSLTNTLKTEIAKNPEGKPESVFGKLVQRFLDWLHKLFNITTIAPADLSKMALDEIASYINTKGVEIPLPGEDYLYYSLDGENPLDEEHEDKEVADNIAYGEHKTAKELNKERALSSISDLENIITNIKKDILWERKEAGRVKTLELLINNLKESINIYDNNVETISVTKYLGAKDLETKNPKASEISSKFGTFLHNAIDELTKEYNKRGGKTTPINILNESGWLESFMNKTIQEATSKKDKIVNKDLILIKDAEKPQLLSLLNDIVASVQKSIAEGDILIPEFSIIKEDLHGRLILGRIDYMSINSKGDVQVYDLKTMLIDEMQSKMDSFPFVKINTVMPYTKAWKPGAEGNIAEIKNRSKIDEYNMQTSLYSEMLNGIGVNVVGKSILCAAIGVRKNTEGTLAIYNNNYKIRTLTNHDFHSYDAYGITYNNDRADAIERIIRTNFRTAEELNGNQEPNITQENPFALFSEDEKLKITNVLKELAEKQIDAIEKQIEEIEKNSGLSIAQQREKKDPLVRRLFAVRETKRNIEAGVTGETPEAIAMGHANVIKTALDVFDHELDNIIAEVNEITMPSTLDLKSKDQYAILKNSRSKSETIDAIVTSIDSFYNTVKNSDVDQDVKNAIGSELKKITTKADTAKRPIQKLNKEVIKAIIKNTIGEGKIDQNKFTKVMGQQKERLEPYIANLKKKIADIEAGVTTPEGSYLTKAGRVLSSFVKGTKGKEESLESLKEELAKLESITRIDKLDDTVLDAYIDGIFNTSTSPFYMGQTIATNSNMPIDMDSFISSSLNPELIINSMWQFMYSATQKAMQDFENEAYKQDVDTLKNKAIDHAGGIENLNKKLSEKIIIDGEEHDQFRNPVREAFKQAIDKFEDTRREINEKIKIAEKELRTLRNDVVAETAKKDEIKALYKSLSDNEKAYVQWQIQYVQTKKKPEVLELEVSGGQLNADIVAILNEINQTVISAGTDRESGYANLTQDHIDKIEELNVRLAKKREELKKSDPDSYEKVKQYMTYFEYVPNYNYYEKIKNSIIAQYGINSPQYKRWYTESTDIVPTKNWSDKISDIFEQLAEFGQDDTIKNIIDEQNSIKRKYIVNGKFNPTWMDEEDSAKYIELENIKTQRFEEMAAELEDEDLIGPEEQLANLIKRDLFNQLNQISIKGPSVAYIEKRDRLKQNVLTANKEVISLQKTLATSPDLSMAERASLQNQLANAEAQLARQEQVFSDFFNSQNFTTYEFGSLVKGIDLREEFKPFVLVRRPSRQEDTEEVPNKRFRIKRLKDEALNPNYQDSFEQKPNGRGFYPMPKGITFNEQTHNFDISNPPTYVDQTTGQTNTFVNPNFLEMTNDPILKEFYKKWVVENFLLKQKDASGRRLGYHFPYQDAGIAENIRFKGVSGVLDEVKQKIQEASLPNSEIEKATNISGLGAKEAIKFPSNYRMKSELNSQDGVGSILAWNKDYHVNKSMAEASILMDSTLDYLKDTVIELTKNKDKELEVKQINTIIQQIEFERNKFIYGQLYAQSDKNVSKLMNRKTAQIIMKVASISRMAFDVPMQFGNVLAGNVQAFLSTCETRHATAEDYAAAKAYLYSKLFPNMLKDYGNFSDVSFETKMYRWWNPSSKDLSKQLDMNTADKARRITNKVLDPTELSMMLQDKGEFEIAATTMAMILHHKIFEKYKVDAAGNLELDSTGLPIIEKDSEGKTVYVNGLEVLEEKADGTVGLRKDVNINEQEAASLKVTITNELTRFQGNYASDHRSKFGGTLMGSLYEFYRKYLIPAVAVRFGGLGNSAGYEGIGSAYSWGSEECLQGWYTVLFQMFHEYSTKEAFKALVLGIVPKSLQNKLGIKTTVNSYYASRASMATREMLSAILFYMIYEGIRALVMSSDDDDLSYTELMLLKSLVKVSNESRSLTPLPVAGKMGDYIDNFGQFTSAFKEGKTLVQLADHSLFFLAYNVTDSPFAYERGYYMRDSGRWEKGDPKVLKNLSDLSGWSNIVGSYDPYKDLKQAVVTK
jgi:hypothetical protein